MLQRISSAVLSRIAAIGMALGGTPVGTLPPEQILPLSAYGRAERRRLRYGNRSRTPGKAQPAGSKAVRIANV